MGWTALLGAPPLVQIPSGTELNCIALYYISLTACYAIYITVLFVFVFFTYTIQDPCTGKKVTHT